MHLWLMYLMMQSLLLEIYCVVALGQAQQEILHTKFNDILPKFRSLSQAKKLEIFLYGYNLKSEEFDCRNIPLTFAVQKYILSTKRFSDQKIPPWCFQVFSPHIGFVFYHSSHLIHITSWWSCSCCCMYFQPYFGDFQFLFIFDKVSIFKTKYWRGLHTNSTCSLSDPFWPERY